MLYVFFGLIASGKSTLAKAWAKHLGITYLNSDVVRKKIAGEKAEGLQPFKRGIYSESFTRKTYESLLAGAAKELAQGRSVILDASYRSRADRQDARELAKKYGTRVLFVLCSCPEKEIRRRLAERALDPLAVSDGRWEIYAQQKKTFARPDELAVDELFTMPTMAPVDILVERLSRKLNRHSVKTPKTSN
jgi:hypothetical protein